MLPLPRRQDAAGAQRHGQAAQVRVGLDARHRDVRAEAGRRGAAAAERVDALAGEPAVARLAEAQRQLHDFTVVRTGDRPRLGRGIGVQLVGGVQLVIRQRDVHRAVDVAQAGRDGAGVVGGLEAGLRGGGVSRVERVADAELEAAERRGLIHDHVVVAVRVGGAQSHADVSLTEASAERVDRAEVLRRDVGRRWLGGRTGGCFGPIGRWPS
ncbi:hypothetical protein G6F31_016290 [Rhizopus arrhizus]|nr:hypothetical protein G6F31_016290 [Rhizopus arrhizus]